MSLIEVKEKSRIRGDPICRGCYTNIKKLLLAGRTVYSKIGAGGNKKYYCKKCAEDIFGGVRLREEQDPEYNVKW